MIAFEQDPAFSTYGMDLFKNILLRVDSPGELGQYLTGHIRQMTGAGSVLLVQNAHETGPLELEPRLIAIDPTSSQSLVARPEFAALARILNSQQQIVVWTPGEESKAAGLLERLGFGLSLGIPLGLGIFRVGSLLVLGLPDAQHISDVIELIKMLAPVVALALRNSFLYTGMEQVVEERTRQLQASNAALRQSEADLSLRNQISNIFLTRTGQQMYAEVMQVFLSATGSSNGFLGTFDEEGRLVFLVVTPQPVPGPDAPPVWFMFPSAQRQNSDMWRAVEEKRVIYNNQANQRVAADHMPIMRFVIVPVIHQDQVIGLMVVCNKVTDYTDQDLHALQVIEQNLAPILSAHLQQQREEQERRRAEAELRASEEKLRSFFNSALIGVSFGALDGAIVDANDEYLRMVGYSRADLDAGRINWRSITPPEFLALDDQGIAEVRQHGACVPFEKQYIRKDGTRVWVIIGFTFLGEGSQELSAAFTLDITARQQQAERLQAILDNIPLLIDSFDLQGRLLWGNRCWEETLGWSLDEALADSDRMFAELYPDPAYRQSILENIRQANGKWNDCVGRARDGRLLDVSWANIRLSDGSMIGIGQDITARKQAEQALRVSEKRYRLISENAADVIWTVNAAEERFTYVSPSVQKLRGFTPEEVLTQPMVEAMTAESYRMTRERLPERMAAFAAGDESARIRTIRLDQPRKDGSIVPTEVVTTLLTDDTGRVTEILAVSRDITERQKIEDVLRRSEATLAEAQRLAGLGSSDYDPVNDQAVWSDNMFRIFDVEPSADHIVPLSFILDNRVHSDDRQRLARTIAEAASEKKPYDIEYRILWRDQSEHTIHSRGQPYNSQDGGPQHLLVVAQDITQQKRVEAARRASEERFTSFMDHLPAMAFIEDKDMRIVYLNQYNKDFFGWKDAVGTTASDFFPPADAAQTYADDQIVLAGGQVVRIVSERDKDNAEYIFKLVKFPLSQQGSPPMIAGISIDISEQIRAEEEVRKLNASLEQRVAERMAQLQAVNQELEAFSYSVSHDLRAPLRAIDGFSRILLEDFSASLEPEAQRFLGLVRSNTRQMDRLVDDLLAFSRLSHKPLHREEIDPAAEVRAVMEGLEHEGAGRQVELVIGDLPPLQADPPLVRQVFMNLLSNALKFTRQRPLTRIEVGFTPAAGLEGSIPGLKSAGVYFIKDNGVGFDMRFAGKLFTAFQRLHRFEDYEGTGIGLAIVQRIITRHGGRVWAEAEAGQGATFFFTLPDGTIDE